MNKDVVFNGGGNQTAASDTMLKATALLYLEQALITERYEECAGLISYAKRFGARQRDIRGILAGYGYRLRPQRPIKPGQGNTGRLLF